MSALAVGASPSPSPSPSPDAGMSATNGASPTPAHLFRVRPMRLEDLEDLRELARHTYDGFDYVPEKLGHWMRHPADFVCLAITYEGIASDSPAGGEPTTTDRGVPLTSLRRSAAPVPPESYLDSLPSDGKWTHESLTIRPRNDPAQAASIAAAASGAALPSSPPAAAVPDEDAARALRKLSPPIDGGGDRWIAPSPPCIAPLSSFVGHVVCIEVLCLFDGRSSGFLQALRVHPAARGFGLSSLIHARMLSLAEHVYHVARVRETTSGGNKISLHLGAKHGLMPVRAYDSGFFNEDQVAWTLRQAERQLAYLQVPSSAVDLDLRDGLVHRGRASDVLRMVSAHAEDESIDLLRQYWMLYAPTEDNLVYLCTEAVLGDTSASDAKPRRNFSALDPQQPSHLLCATERPYFLVTADRPQSSSSSIDGGASVGAFGISLISKDMSGHLRTFSLYAPTPAAAKSAGADDDQQQAAVWQSDSYRSMLLLWVYQLRAASAQRHETAHYRCDATGLPISGTEWTGKTYPHPIRSMQTSTPAFFAKAWQALQRKVDAEDAAKAAVGSNNAVVLSPFPASSPNSSADAGLSVCHTWQPECRMMVLERTMCAPAQFSNAAAPTVANTTG